MFDDLRQQADDVNFEDDNLDLEPAKRKPRYLLGMTPVQRFVLATMLLFMVCILGLFALLVTQKIVPPFLF